MSPFRREDVDWFVFCVRISANGIRNRDGVQALYFPPGDGGGGGERVEQYEKYFHEPSDKSWNYDKNLDHYANNVAPWQREMNRDRSLEESPNGNHEPVGLPEEEHKADEKLSVFSENEDMVEMAGQYVPNRHRSNEKDRDVRRWHEETELGDKKPVMSENEKHFIMGQREPNPYEEENHYINGNPTRGSQDFIHLRQQCWLRVLSLFYEMF